MRWKRAIVVGASSGIGRSIAERLAAEGVAVSLVARRSETLSEVCDSINARDGHTQAWSYPSDVYKRQRSRCSSWWHSVGSSPGWHPERLRAR